jgi:glycine/D-amino acid oxidase-like deaminating enzyme
MTVFSAIETAPDARLLTLAARLLHAQGGAFRMGVQLSTVPYWKDSTDRLPAFPRLEHNQQADVVVVGGGVTGLTAAYLAAQSGRSVILLERRELAEIDTGHTTAHLTMVTDAPITELVKTFGRNHAQASWDAGLAALGRIDEIVHAERIACDFEWVPGYLHAPHGEAEAGQLASLEEQASLASELGFDATFVHDVPLFHTPGIRFDGQARFHPRKYLAGLTAAAVRLGVRIYERSEATEFSEKAMSMRVNGSTVSCDYLVIATHNPLVGLASVADASFLQTKLALYATYAVSARVPTGRVPDSLFWDTDRPYHYLRVASHRDADEIVYGGADHKTGQVEDTGSCFDSLERQLKSWLPDAEITHRWSGQVIETPDGLPYIGENADRQFIATGYAGNGLTFGTLAGMMAADLATGRDNPWLELFDPRRRTLSAAWDYLKENKRLRVLPRARALRRRRVASAALDRAGPRPRHRSQGQRGRRVP